MLHPKRLVKTLQRIAFVLGLGLLIGSPLWAQVAPKGESLHFRRLAIDSLGLKHKGSEWQAKIKGEHSLRRVFDYDKERGVYLLRYYLGNEPWGMAITYTWEQYWAYRLKEIQALFEGKEPPRVEERQRERKRVEDEEQGLGNFDLRHLRFGQSTSERIFGKGGLKLRLRGRAELGAGVRTTRIDNPMLSAEVRDRTTFNLKEHIQANAEASLGTRLKMGLNYNTESTFDFDSRRLKLRFEGEEDDMIRLVEVGNVAMRPRNSLIQGGSALFGMRSQLQIGRLSLDMLVSQQRSERRRISTSTTAQTKAFELKASDYDENRHFFLAEYFRRHYDEALGELPNVRSEIQIIRIELWVTNKRNSYDEARSVLAFADLGEDARLHNANISRSATATVPNNTANSLYRELLGDESLRRGSTEGLSSRYQITQDFESLESARKLTESEYTLHPQLGFVSLSARLASDEVLAVAFEYSYRGQSYKVGEFSSDRQGDSWDRLYLKLLKGSNLSPSTPYWQYMMRNVYSLGNGVYNLEREGFRLDVLYRSDALGTYMPQLPSASLSGRRLLNLVGLDGLDRQQRGRSDGLFDFVAGLTVNPSLGLVYLPRVEPFGDNLVREGAGEDLAYRELYSQTKSEAERRAEKNKFLLKGEYRASTMGEILLGTSNVAKGSVQVTSGGVELREEIDYTVDYMAGIVRIINQQLLASRQPLEVSLEDTNSLGTSARKTMLGLDMVYQLRRNLELGATAMYLSEKPLTPRFALGNEANQNFLWGASLRWHTKGQWLTRLLNRLPFLSLREDSQLSLDAEFAQLLPGHYQGTGDHSGYSYLDDFESGRGGIDLLNPYAWTLASAPITLAPSTLTPLESGFGRAHLSWFSIDPLFTRADSRLTPEYIRRNPRLVSSHYTREVEMRELYPYRDFGNIGIAYQPTLSLHFYPRERGMYNLGTERLDDQGRFVDPRASWGGIMRPIAQSDFEASNVEYIEFWLMDPFLEKKTHRGGDLYINLGDISEDVLRDGKKAFENGLPTTEGDARLSQTAWGRVLNMPSLGYTFDNAAGTLERQDLGLNGLSTEAEQRHPSYMTYLARLRAILSPEAIARMQVEASSPFRDPGGDNFRHYNSAVYDEAETPIIERYKYYNGTEGNSSGATDQSSSTLLVSRSTPDVEDINQDNSLNELDRYLEYRISLRPEDLREGSGYVVASREVDVRLLSGETSRVRWYQFRVPITNYSRAVGGISNLRSMRFVRLYLSDFEDEVDLRFGTLRLVRGDWRVYNESLVPGAVVSPMTRVELGAVNIEEHGDRKPINYVLPPSASRTLDESSSTTAQLNEGALSLHLEDLAAGDSRAIYRNVMYDLRRYRRLQLSTHLEALLQETNSLEDDDLELFLRIGSDYQSNYYEYTLPLKLTPHGQYNASYMPDRMKVWREENFLDLHLEALTELKRQRNASLGSAGSSLYRLYERSYERGNGGRIGVLGNPSLSNVRTLMIGIRNRSSSARSAEIWFNELRVGDYYEERAWGAKANLSLKLAELGDLRLAGYYSTAGFGGLDQSLTERQLENRQALQLSTTLELGKLLPESAKAQLPLYLSYSDEQSRPEYNPLDEDIRLDEALSSASTDAERQHTESLALRRRTSRTIALSGANIGIRSRDPMPYDPANLSFSFSHTTSREHSPTTDYLHRLHWQAGLSYDYSPRFAPLHPFSGLKGEGRLTRYLQAYGLALWPYRISFETTLMRNYEEEQLRAETADLGADLRPPLSFAQQFVWYRKMHLQWRLSPNLNLSLQTGTDARIEEPFVQVNRHLNPDDYALWRESVDRSIVALGTPERYSQTALASYKFPTEALAATAWLSPTLSYSSAYSWELGAERARGGERLANTLSNQMALELNVELDWAKLYKLFPALRRLEETKGEKSNALRHILRSLLLMPRELQASYRLTQSSYLMGYLPSVGKAFGQGSSPSGLAPGIGFALGLEGEGFLDKALERSWLSLDSPYPYTAVFSQSRTLDLKATLMPLPDLNIKLSASYNQTERSEHLYTQAGRPRRYGGDLIMTTIGLRGFFESLPTSSDGYHSSRFEHFLTSRSGILERQAERLRGEVYPSSGVFASSPWAGQSVVLPPSAENSPAVLLSAFRSAYTLGGRASSVNLNALPSILSLLPNWSVSYSGLSRLAFVKAHLRSLTLRHAYRGVYRIDSYSSYASFQPSLGAEGLGFLPNETSPSEAPVLSLPYDVSSASLVESFYPLLGIDMTLRSGLTLSTNYRRSRSLSLSLVASRLMETQSSELAFGLSYRLSHISQLWSPHKARKAGSSTGGILLRFDYSYRRSLSLFRQIDRGYTQASSGQADHRLSLSADYNLSRNVTLRAYYETTRNTPLVASRSYPIYQRSYGLALRLNLAPH